jgi:hypothetical protein
MSPESARALLARFAHRLRGDASGSFLVDAATYSREAAVLESLGWVRCTPRAAEGALFYDVQLTPLGLHELGGMEKRTE